MKVRALQNYYDKELEKLVKVDEEVDISNARYKLLSSSENPAREPLVKRVPVKRTKKVEE